MPEVNELGQIIQLSPHGQTEKVAKVTEPADGEGLVSLDDLYEVSGQESIGIIAKDAAIYYKTRKLSKMGMSALLISGCESFMPGYDRLNGRLGGESFVSKLKEGFVAMVKAIARWVSSLIDWIIAKVKVFFGFSKTEKETIANAKYLPTLQATIEKLMEKTLGSPNGTKLFDINELMEALPPAVTGKEVMTIFKNRTDSNAKAVERLDKATVDIEKAKASLADAVRKSRAVKGNYRRIMDNFARDVKGGKLTEGDIIAMTDQLNQLLHEDLGVEKYIQQTEELVKRVYDIDLSGLGADRSFKASKEMMDNVTTRLRANVVGNEAEVYQKYAQTYQLRVAEGDTFSVDADKLKELREVVNAKDADLLKAVVDQFPEHGSMISSYLEFSNAISRFNEALLVLSEVLTRIAVTSQSISRWNTSLNVIASAYMVSDLEKIIKAHDEYTGGVSEFTGQGENDRYLLIEPGQLRLVNHFYPGFNLAEDARDYAKSLTELPEVKKVINNMSRELGLALKV